MSKLKILIIEGSSRKGRKSIEVAKLIQRKVNETLETEGFLIDPIDIKYSDSGKDINFTRLTQIADAFIIVSPEYNHSFPGTLKTLLDSELENYKHKPVLVAGVSNGSWGGTRMIEQLAPVLRRLGMIMTINDLQFPHVNSLFDENGCLLELAVETRIESKLDELIALAAILKTGKIVKSSKN